MCVQIRNLEEAKTTFDPKFLEKPAVGEKKEANFSTGTADWCQKQREAANTIIAQTPDPTKILNRELKILLLPLNIKVDGLMPTWKKEMIESYMRWKNRAPPMFDVSVAPVEEGNGGAGDADDSDEADDELGYAVADT